MPGADVADRPAPRPPPRRAAGRAARHGRSAGASSTSFWCRRCTEQSRSPSASTVPCASAEDLHLHVPGPLQPPLHEDGAVAEGGRRLPPRRPHRLVQRGPVRHHPHAPPAPAVRGLDQQRVARVGRHRVGRPGRQHRHAGRGHPGLGVHLGPHRGDGLRRRPDPGQPGVQHRPGEAGVLGQEAVAGVHGVGAGPDRGIHQQVRPQVRSAARPGSATAASASATQAPPASGSECTATGATPSSRQVRITRRAISPRLATSSRPIASASITGTPRSPGCPATVREWMLDRHSPSTVRVSRGSITPSS